MGEKLAPYGWSLPPVRMVERGKTFKIARKTLAWDDSQNLATSDTACDWKPGDKLCTGIYNLDQLDRQEDNRLSVDVIARLEQSLANAGVTPAQMSTYLAACKQGWAPAPTNDVQKAIWDKVHAVPATPMKIEFDPKKGR